MTAIESCELQEPRVRHGSAAGSRVWHGLGSVLGRARQSYIEWRTARILYRLDPRQLEDIGFDPAEVYDAFRGTLEEVYGDRFRGLSDVRRSGR